MWPIDPGAQDLARAWILPSPLHVFMASFIFFPANLTTFTPHFLSTTLLNRTDIWPDTGDTCLLVDTDSSCRARSSQHLPTRPRVLMPLWTALLMVNLHQSDDLGNHLGCGSLNKPCLDCVHWQGEWHHSLPGTLDCVNGERTQKDSMASSQCFPSLDVTWPARRPPVLVTLPSWMAAHLLITMDCVSLELTTKTNPCPLSCLSQSISPPPHSKSKENYVFLFRLP